MQLVCRTCLQEVEDLNFISLKDLEKSEEIKQQLKLCVPELSLHTATVDEPVVCSECVEALKTAYNFKTLCLRTEERIKSYVKNLILKSNVIDLGEVFQQKDELDLMDVDCDNDDAIFVIEIKDEQEEETEVEQEIEKESVGMTDREKSYQHSEASCSRTDLQYQKTPPSHERVNVIDKSILKKHYIIPSDSRPYRSPVKEYSCKFKNDLILHLKRQIGEIRRYHCPQCDHTSITEYGLRKHITVLHLGLKLIKCNNCPFFTTDQQALTKHLLTHDIKPFLCTMCIFTATSKDLLIEHLRSHVTNSI